ncbi:hypothetical protein GLU64_00160 [Nanohaloarchaea archaeon]|nr:hypothetical protein [Candidatus Nanohaloarchaea archaeon]
MERVSPSSDVVSSIENTLVKIEEQQEHDKEKVSKSMSRLEEHGGIELYLGDHFEIKKRGGEQLVGSPGSARMMIVGKMKPSLNGDMYIVGRDIDDARQLVYYKVDGGNVTKRDCGQKADVSVSRFNLAIIPGDDRVEIFNIGKNETDLYFEGEVKF